MLDPSSQTIETDLNATDTWAHPQPNGGAEWRVVDRALREIRACRSELDADEAHWLREAEGIEIWHPLGMVSILDYLERALGYSPRTAQDRLRVARTLGTLPQLTAALSSDALSYSAVRELTRVATPATEAAWITAAAGKNLRQIEALVADRRPGDRPGDPPEPLVRTHVVRFELAPETFALLRQARVALDDVHGTNQSDDSFVTALCSAALDQAAAAEPTGRARYQVAVTVCARCQQGWQHGGGATLAIAPAAVERAMCDAQHIGSIDGSAPERAYQDVPPSVARFVWHRDRGRCRVDGCRSARGLELHHLVHREHGGSHDASNIVLCCGSCHRAHHAGLLELSGTADDLTVNRPHLDTSDHRSTSRRGLRTSRLAHPAVRFPARSQADVTAARGDERAHVGARDAAIATVDPRATASRHSASAAPARGGAHVDAANGAASSADPDATARRHLAPAASARDRAHVGAASGTASSGDPHAIACHGPAPTSPGCSRPHGDATRPAPAIGGGPEYSARSSPVTTPASHASSELDAAVLCAETKLALTGLGWKTEVANTAISAAISVLGTQISLEQLIRESLRRCPRPRA